MTGSRRDRRHRFDSYLAPFESPDFAPFIGDDEAGSDG